MVTLLIDGFCKLEVKPPGPLQLYDKVPVPPVAELNKFNVFPAQTGVLDEGPDIATATGWEIIMLLSDVVQPLASVTVTA